MTCRLATCGRHRGIALAIATLVLVVHGAAAADPWRELAPGLDLARFSVTTLAAAPAGELVVLRVDPQRWQLAYYAGQDHGGQARTVTGWCQELGLVAAINAGMYQGDGSSHVGFLQLDGRVRQRQANHYLSAMGLSPLDDADPDFRLFDLDETPLDEVSRRYRCVVQNLRLIKRPRLNRWQPQDRRWREAALGEDARGQALLIFCETPLSMHDFNEVLLALPIDLVSAQHLDGNLPAQLQVQLPDFAAHFPATAESPAVPNVLGVTARH